MMSMKMHTSLPLILLLGASMLPERANAQTDQKHQIPIEAQFSFFSQTSIWCSCSAASDRTTVTPCSFRRKIVPVPGRSTRWITPLTVARGVGPDEPETLRTSYWGSCAGALGPFAETNKRPLGPIDSALDGCRYPGSAVRTGCLEFF